MPRLRGAIGAIGFALWVLVPWRDVSSLVTGRECDDQSHGQENDPEDSEASRPPDHPELDWCQAFGFMGVPGEVSRLVAVELSQTDADGAEDRRQEPTSQGVRCRPDDQSLDPSVSLHVVRDEAGVVVRLGSNPKV